MKKLMIAAAIVSAAVVSQAAQTMWGANTGTGQYWKDGYKQASGGTYTAANLANGVAVYLIANAIHAEGSGVGISQAKLVEAFQNATAEKPFNLASYRVAGSEAGATKSGKVYGSGSQIATFTNPDDFTGGTDYNFYLAALVKDTDGKEFLYVTDSVSKQAGSETATQTISTFKTTESSKVYKGAVDYAGAGWYTTAVPEPTSGLLLLLGVAGLALRRRRA